MARCSSASARIRVVRTPSDMQGVDAVILPGGETPRNGNFLLKRLDKTLLAHATRGGAIFGTCAGAILLARESLQSRTAVACTADHHGNPQRLRTPDSQAKCARSHSPRPPPSRWFFIRARSSKRHGTSRGNPSDLRGKTSPHAFKAKS